MSSMVSNRTQALSGGKPVCFFHSQGDNIKYETQLDDLLAPVMGPGYGQEQEGEGLGGGQISTP